MCSSKVTNLSLFFSWGTGWTHGRKFWGEKSFGVGREEGKGKEHGGWFEVLKCAVLRRIGGRGWESGQKTSPDGKVSGTDMGRCLLSFFICFSLLAFLVFYMIFLLLFPEQSEDIREGLYASFQNPVHVGYGDSVVGHGDLLVFGAFQAVFHLPGV